MITLKECPICSSKTVEPFLDSRDHFLSKEPFSIVRCSSCGFRFTNPRPDNEELSEYYKSEEYISHSNTNKGLSARLYKLVRNFTLGLKERLITRYVSRGTILDYGCGTGHFLSYCKSKGWHTTGFEPDSGASDLARNQGITVYSKESDLINSEAKYNVISLWHVLEHLAELKETIQYLKGKLKPKGILVIAVPNPESFDAKYYGSFWAAYDLPRHLYHFSSKDMERLFSDLGFEMVNKRGMYFDSVYVSLLSEKYKRGKQSLLLAPIIGLCSNLMALFSQEYSSNIYIFRLKP